MLNQAIRNLYSYLSAAKKSKQPVSGLGPSKQGAAPSSTIRLLYHRDIKIERTDNSNRPEHEWWIN